MRWPRSAAHSTTDSISGPLAQPRSRNVPSLSMPSTIISRRARHRTASPPNPEPPSAVVARTYAGSRSRRFARVVRRIVLRPVRHGGVANSPRRCGVVDSVEELSDLGRPSGQRRRSGMWSRAAIEVAVEPDVDVPAVGGEWMDSLPPEPGLEQRNPRQLSSNQCSPGSTVPDGSRGVPTDPGATTAHRPFGRNGTKVSRSTWSGSRSVRRYTGSTQEPWDVSSDLGTDRTDARRDPASPGHAPGVGGRPVWLRL